MTQITLPSVARRFLYDCKKCEAERFHIVLTHIDSESAKVQCEVCQSKKTYRLPRAQARTVSVKSAKTGAPKVGRTSAASHQRQYQELQEKFNGKAPSAYTMKTQYRSEQVIEHPKFGIGFVLEASQDRIQVVFSDEVKTLIHNRV